MTVCGVESDCNGNYSGFLCYSQNTLKNQDFYAILRNRCKEEICNLQGFIEAISDKWG